MRKEEAAITPRINKWFAPIVPTSSPWEVKHTRGSLYFNMSELREHQKNYLLAATTPRGCTFKIEDAGYNHPPFDVLHYKNTPAYVIIAFPTLVAAIEIRTLLRYDAKSLTEDEAVAMASWSIHCAKLPK